MIRRHFLGTVLGYVASTGLPWIAEKVDKKAPSFQAAIRLPSGLLIKAPPFQTLILDDVRGSKLHLSRIKYEDIGIPKLLTKSYLTFIGHDTMLAINAVGTGNDGTGVLFRLPKHLPEDLLAKIQAVTPEVLRRTYDEHRRWKDNDLYCRKCKKKISFDAASLLDMPPCSGCGYVVPKEELEGDNREVEQFKQFLREKKKSGT